MNIKLFFTALITFITTILICSGLFYAYYVSIEPEIEVIEKDFVIKEHFVKDIKADIEADVFSCSAFDDINKYPVSSDNDLIINYVDTYNKSIVENSKEFVLLHTTEINLCTTLDVFLDEDLQVSSHFIVSELGQVFMMVDPSNVAWHAGASMWYANEKEYDKMNSNTIGIELVNELSYVFEFPESQMTALSSLVGFLFEKYDELETPEQIISHELTSGFVGKTDPGIYFDWDKLYIDVFGEEVKLPYRNSVIDDATATYLKENQIRYQNDYQAVTNLAQLRQWKNNVIGEFNLYFSHCASEFKDSTPYEWYHEYVIQEQRCVE